MELPDELRNARLAAGITQEELAFRADVSRNYISLLEHGEKSPTVHVFLRICRALNISAAEVIGRIERNQSSD